MDVERIAIRHFLLTYLIPDLADIVLSFLPNARCKTLLLPSGIDTCGYCRKRKARIDTVLKLQLDEKELEIFRLPSCHLPGSNCTYLAEKTILAVSVPCLVHEAIIWEGRGFQKVCQTRGSAWYSVAERKKAIKCCDDPVVKRVIAFPRALGRSDGLARWILCCERHAAHLDDILVPISWQQCCYGEKKCIEC